MEAITIIGFIAAAFTTGSFVPQVIKTVKTKHTQDISFFMYLILLVGISLWFIYGILITDLPIIAANGITLMMVAFVFALKIRYK